MKIYSIMEDKTMYLFLLPLVAVALIMLPLFISLRRHKAGKPTKTKRAILINACSFIGCMVLFTILLPTGGIAFAEEAAAGTAAALGVGDGLKYLGAALAT